MGLLFLLALVAGPIALTAAVGMTAPSLPFRWATVFKLYLTLLFGGVGLYGHLLHPGSVVELIPPFFPFRTLLSYVTGIVELAFAVLLWTRHARIAAFVIMAYLVLVLPFNVYGWTIPGNRPSYVNAPYYLWVRIPLQAAFMLFAWFGTRKEGAPRA